MSYSSVGSISTISIVGQFYPPKWADAVARCDLSAGAICLAMILLGHFDYETGICWRAMKGIACQLGKSLRSIQRYRRELELAGLLTRWQPSGRKCNRYRATMPSKVVRPAPEPVPEPQIELEFDSTPTVTPVSTSDPVKPDTQKIELAPLEQTDSSQSGTPSQSSSTVENTVENAPQNKKSHPRGDTPGVSPRTVIRTSHSKLGTVASAPSGFATRPLTQSLPSAKGEHARTTLRQLGVREIVVRYLALVCTAHELDWLAAEAAVARNPGRYVRYMFNLLASGNASPWKRRRHKPDPRSIGYYDQPDTRTDEEKQADRLANAEANRRALIPRPPRPEPEAVPELPVAALPAPPLYHDPEGWRAAWSDLDEATRTAGAIAWRESELGRSAGIFGHGRMFDKARRRFLTGWLENVDLGVAEIDRISDENLRDKHQKHARRRAQHMADHPELYGPEDDQNG